jgi:hypothetical protein
MNKTNQWNSPISDNELFSLLRDLHDSDEACWDAVDEAQEIYEHYLFMVNENFEDDSFERTFEEAA